MKDLPESLAPQLVTALQALSETSLTETRGRHHELPRVEVVARVGRQPHLFFLESCMDQ
uniref:Uncharacterized protein n=1 Tax=Arundo donax TaxID=35708 RepID=A0A0A9FJ68_ARUDO